MRKLGAGCLAVLSAAVVCGQPPGIFSSPASKRALLDQYCAGCHNDKLKTGGLSLAKLDVAHLGQHAQEWEKVVLKLRAGMMPPAGLPRPTASTIDAFASALETELDQAAAAN